MGTLRSIFSPLGALLWKNFLLRWNSRMSWLMEILIPALLALMFYGLHSLMESRFIPNCNLKPKALPTASGMLALQTFLCTVSNTCEDKSEATFDSFKPSGLSTLEEAIKSAFNIKPNSKTSRKRDIELNLENLSKDLYTIDTLIETINNQNEKWKLLYNILLRSNIYSETNESENYQIKKLLKIKNNMYTTGVTKSVLHFLIQNVISSSPEMKILDLFFCGPNVIPMDYQLLMAFKTKDRFKETKVKYKRDDDFSDECNSIFKNLEAGEYREVFNYLKPLLKGKVVYTPDAPVINRIMKRLNESFMAVKKILDLMKVAKRAWDDLRTWRLDDVIDKYKNEKNFLREAVETKAWKEFMGSFAGDSQPKSALNKMDKFRKLLEKTRRNYRTFLKEAADSLLPKYVGLLECMEWDRVVAVSDEGDALAKARSYSKDQKLWGYVIFTNVPSGADELPKSVTYKLRVPASKAPNTKYKRNVNVTAAPRNPVVNIKEITGGTVHLQNLIDGELIREYTGKAEVPGIYLQQMPYPCHKTKEDTSQILIYVTVLSWAVFFSRLVKKIIIEKEILFKDVLRIFGVKSYHHWVAFFIESLITGLIGITITALILQKIYDDFAVIFVFQLAFIISCISLAFLLSTFFRQANFSVTLSCMVFLALSMIFFVLKNVQSAAALVFFCFIPIVAGEFGATWISDVAQSRVTLSLSNINYCPDFGSSLSMLVIIIMLLIDSVICIALTFYFENILTKGALRKPWFYCLTASYWQNCFKSNIEMEEAPEPEAAPKRKDKNSKNFEAEPEGLQAGIEVVNVSKEFGTGKKKIKVVNNLSVTFYENQITAFLGHNGAGKSTTVAMMTGVIPATKGTIRIYGIDLQKYPSQALDNIGLCMQENVLLGDLSAKDHLKLIGKLKNLPAKKIKSNVKELIDVFEFKERAKQPTKHLSGGWKRKVCVAMAFMGGSRTIFLDEPTAGIDPFARRTIWEVLSKLKSGRTIVLITHHLDEADILGDRVAIIASGELKCCGTSAFLKSQLDKSYTLTVDTSVRPDLSSAKKTKNSKKALSSQAQEVNNVVKSAIPNAEFDEERGCEIIFSLPPRQGSGDLNRVFDALERNKKRLNITSYGISAASLEEVFLKVLMKVEAEEDSKEGAAGGSGLEKTSVQRIESAELENRNSSQVSRHHSEISRPTEANNTKRMSTLEEEEKDYEVLPEERKPEKSVENYEKSSTRLSESEMKRMIANRQKEKLKSGRMIGHHFIAILIKRIIHNKRNYVFFIIEVFAPFLYFAFSLMIHKLDRSFSDVVVDVSAYEKSLLFYTSSESPSPTLSSYEDALLGPYGLGTKCVLTPEKCSLESIPRGSLVASGPTIDSNKCTCEDQDLKCEGDATEDPPNAEMTSGHRLFNMTGLDLHNWLLAMEFTYSLNRIGGITFGYFAPLTGVSIADFIHLFSDNKLAEVVAEYMSKAKKIDAKELSSKLMDVVDNSYGKQLFANKDPSNNIIIWFNGASKIGAMALINGVTNLVLRASLPNGTDPSSYSIQLQVHPFDLTGQEFQPHSRSLTTLVYLLTLFQVFGLLFGLLIIYVVDERYRGLKHLEIIYGVNPFIYWLANFLWDMMLFSVFFVLVLVLIFSFDISEFSSPNALPVFTAILFSYGVTTILFIYLWSLYFHLSSNAFIFIFFWIFLITGFGSILIVMISSLSSSKVVEVLQKVALFIPEYCFTKSIFNLSLNVGFSTSSLFDWEISAKYIFHILYNGGAYLLILLLVEYRNYQPLGLIVKALASTKVLCRPRKKIAEDEDVAAEKERVRSGRAKEDGDMLIVKNLTKIYCRQKDPAVNHVCVGVKRGECLGLLGLNGAGKSTFFNMLSGNLTPSLGDATIGGYSISYSPLASRLLIGYCPQVHALDPYLTPVEHLSLFCMIRGVTGKKKKREIDTMIDLMNLTKHKNKLSKVLSGGNKRKLNAAIALLCEPELVLLDEPTAGMDVLARRFLWSRLQEVLQDGRCLVLTTHSMEECQALATQVCIMYMGRFACYGSSQHLKNKFNEGYTAILRLVHADKAEDMTNFLNDNLAGSTVLVSQNVHMKVKLHPDIHIGKAVSALGEAKRKRLIEDYSVNQTSLENVFLKLIGDFDRSKSYKSASCGCC